MPIKSITPDLLAHGLQPVSRAPINFSAARARLDAARAAKLRTLGIGGGLRYGAGPEASTVTLTAMAAMHGDSFLAWDHGDAGVDIFGDRHPYVSFGAIGRLITPSGEEIVQPQLLIFAEALADTLLIEIACQAHRDDNSAPAIKVSTALGEETHALTSGQPDGIMVLAKPAQGNAASAALQMVNPSTVPLPKAGGSWAVFEVRISPLKAG